jgi:hypothetical protein
MNRTGASDSETQSNPDGGRMTIEYLRPISRGWDRMKKALFRPFNLRKWCLVGFTAFLAGLTDWQGNGSGRGSRNTVHDWDDFFRLPGEAREWLFNHPGWSALIILAMFVLLVLSVLFTWLSSRGKFMFLDNVAHDRDRVKAPWNEYRSEGDSLFLWRLGLGVLGIVVIGATLAACYTSLYGMYSNDAPDRTLVMNAVLMGIALLGLAIVFGFVQTFLHDFVTALMYKNRVPTLEAIRRFWKLFTERPVDFLLYGLLVFVLQIFIVAAVVIAGLMTCCIGFAVLAIPYVNAVALLPISYTLRAFSLEFLAQYGPAYNVFGPESKSKSSSAAAIKPGAVKGGTSAKTRKTVKPKAKARPKSGTGRKPSKRV